MVRADGSAADVADGHPVVAAERLFAGPGELRARCRAHDWAATPLGPVEGWSPALRSAARLCLDAGFPTCLYAGDDLVLVYNDGFIEALGRKHPGALGRPAREVWAEVWAQSAPDFARVRATEAAVFHHDQRFLLQRGADGATEEAFYTFAFSPVRDDGGAVVGVLSTVAETTARVRGEAALAAERERLRSLVLHMPAPVALLEGPEHRYTLVNDAYKRVSGGGRDVTGLTPPEAFPELAGSGIYELFDRVYETGAPWDGPETLVRYDRDGTGVIDTWFNLRFEPVRDRDGRVAAVFNFAVDVTDQVRARREVERLLADVRRANDDLRAVTAAARQAERRARFLAELGQALQPLTDPDELMATAARLLGEHVGADRCAYAEVEGDEDHFTITGNYTQGDTASILGRFAFADFGAEVLRLMRENAPYVVEDAAADPRVTPLDRAAYEATQIRAVVCVPLHKAGRFVAAMAVHQRAPRRWAEDEVALVVTVVQRCWESLERARALRRLQEREAALAASERQFRTLADAIPTLAWTAQADGYIDWYNARWYEYTGTTPEQMAGWGWQSVHDPAVLPSVLERWQGSVATGEPFEMTFPLRGADGGFRPFLTRVLPLRDGEGRVVRWFGTNTDVTSEREARAAAERAQAAAEQARRAAEAANRAKGDFLSTMSHELRTPLNAIGGYAELMEMGIRGPITGQQREDLGRIQRSQRHLLGLVNEVLNYAKLETGTVRYDLVDVPLCDALAEAEGLVAPQARAKGLTLAAAECPATLATRADPEKLRQVLVNLLSNAVKFTDPGGRIAVECAAAGDRVRIAVRDTGIGIAADQLERVFEPFVQVRAALTRTAEGTGLGLAISRDLARGMGGELAAESTPGVGSTFTLTLPAV